ncbi:uncharacterized protein LOC124154142 isoform X2 [Ischnura elegans]|uniref:uncharacterized protein LOC124154142 isoform X2 n=1 Tax=Ischnura elegans TaxID=197161 RepID=UPI001ED8845B|nr:uncharacterized protein LOC124154142 isoform X2 [Ischnura elegans]
MDRHPPARRRGGGSSAQEYLGEESVVLEQLPGRRPRDARDTEEQRLPPLTSSDPDCCEAPIRTNTQLYWTTPGQPRSSRMGAHVRWRRGGRHLPTALLLLALLFCSSVVGICPLPHEGIVGEATVAALLALHRGPNCSRVELRGLQQAAALGLAVRRVNELHAEAKDGLSIGLQVLDTCSESEDAVKMALRSLVSSVQASHLPPPLFLGFLGPDEAVTLDAVQKVTGVFKLSHVTPFSLRGRVHNPLHVVAVDPKEKVKMILTLLRRLDWTSFSVLHSGDAVSSDVARILVSEATYSSEPMCVLSVQHLPNAYDAEQYEEIASELAAAKKKGGVNVDLKGKQAAFAAAAAAAAAAGRGPPGVVIIGSLPGPIADFLRYVEVWGLSRSAPATPSSAAAALGGPTPGPDEAAFVVSVSSAGLLPELAALQLGPATSVLVIQETTVVHNGDDDDDEMDNNIRNGGQARPSIHRLANTVANSTLWPPYLLATRGCGGSGDGPAASVVSSCVEAVARSNVEEFYLVQDPSVVPIMDAVRLFSSALAVAHSAKCGAKPGRCPELVSMSADEWRALLATAAVGGDKGRKVHFQMRRQSSAQIYSKTPSDSSPAFLVGTAPGVRLRKVGNMTGGGELNLAVAFHFPVSHNAEGVKCAAAAPETLPPTDAAAADEAADEAGDIDDDDDNENGGVVHTAPPKPRPPTPPAVPKGGGGAAADDDSGEEEEEEGYGFTFDLLEALNGDNMWEVIGILTAAGIAILLVFACFIYAVYASFRVRSDGNGGGRSRGRGGGTGRRPQRRGSGGSVESIQS